MQKEKIINPVNGYLMFAIVLLLVISGIVASVMNENIGFIVISIAGFILSLGFILVNPNSSKVLLFFGKYVGTVKQNGLFWANPLYKKKTISLRASNFDSERLKVNDKLGNPIMISTILVWRVTETYKAAFDVDNYENFVRVQTDAAVRKLASMYPYDNFADEGHKEDITLRSSINEVSQALEKEIEERLSIAGIQVLEARIGYLAYAQEIASAMLKRQQATAIVAARHKIVQGAVEMVEMALNELNKKQIVDLDDERKAAMVSNLLVILCGDKEASPIVNTGTLSH
ncbi:SPFH domain-containing protein [Tenacibaculum finnmarkense]|uniref:SPFH domain-containing protein n=1 Tax=Tenacibaculum finnmarkense genomovar finnmarkense TaxID=1458503 RepID=A0AAP1WFP5_9FLAO|nr:SPFH domain-containing protein [Tenacibaculum finnmarkense]MBE7652303.1 SPFH domain-containing protein [Tenacibaculum finnmarkense genomovar finnmarkense]MBE7694525.1 SPFH domain-containing protein [Tenacibaculum finnmarkense genomovar finnmarkense]MCD8445856.1 SPFH domain-containing protein [Tenacibaculum finnmarkense genomovar finnmarkense]MCG8207526.1 SPFH domain-containing protein [Tenacibaculum finnmarkense genomovar finnmarkense]MCG8723637.1 SPFH domain-containing protein [Tenacibacul